jgi:hypothetical protein
MEVGEAQTGLRRLQHSTPGSQTLRIWLRNSPKFSMIGDKQFVLETRTRERERLGGSDPKGNSFSREPPCCAAQL